MKQRSCRDFSENVFLGLFIKATIQRRRMTEWLTEKFVEEIDPDQFHSGC
jgi:hypothetical protein